MPLEELKSKLLALICDNESARTHLRDSLRRIAEMQDTFRRAANVAAAIAQRKPAYRRPARKPPKPGLVWDKTLSFWRRSKNWPTNPELLFPFMGKLQPDLVRLGLMPTLGRSLTPDERRLTDAVAVAAYFDHLADTFGDVKVNDGLWDNDLRAYEQIQKALLQWLNVRPADAMRYLERALSRIRADLEARGLLKVIGQTGQKPNGPGPASETAGYQHPNRVPWNDSDPAYYSNTNAIKDALKVANDKDIADLRRLNHDKLKKLLRSPGCTIHFMSRSKPFRGKVHKEEWQQYLNLLIKREHFARDRAEEMLGQLKD